MRRRIVVVVGVVLVAVLAGALVLFQPWLLWIDNEGSDAADPSQVVGTASAGLSDSATPGASDGAVTRVVLAGGEFVDGEHATTGTATVYRRSDGTRFLELTGFETSNGPDVHVWLTDRPSAGEWGSYDDGSYVRLGKLRHNITERDRYEIPAGADLHAIRSAVIWCDRFDVAFGTAPLA